MAYGSRRVLVVDDQGTIRLFLAKVLAANGFTPVAVSSMEQAIAELEREPVGVAIVDKNLGEESGLDVLKVIRAKWPTTLVLLHTAYPSTESAIEALREGAFDYLIKSSDSDLLIEKVKRAWSSHKLGRDRAELIKDYETLFEAIPGIVWFTTDSGIFRRISEQGARMLGYRSDEVVGMHYGDVLDPEDADERAHWVFKERRTGSRALRRQIVPLRTKDGEIRMFEMSAAGTYTMDSRELGDGYRGTLAIGWDVTDHVSLISETQQRSKMDALGRFAGGVAHDFNNLLQVVINEIDFVLEDDLSESETKESLDSARDAAQRAAELTRQLLLFSRQRVSRPEIIEPLPVLHQTERMLRRIVRENIELKLDFQTDLGLVRIDPAQLQQVLINLVANASDAMMDGGKLTIHAQNCTIDEEYVGSHPDQSAGEFVMIAVSDSGVGISPKERDRLFEPFFTTKAPGDGTGLGLAIVYGIVRLCGGYISVYTEIAVGTTIKVYLPRTFKSPRRRQPPPDLATFGGRETILLVEDDHRVRRVASRCLHRAGYRVLEAATGGDALRVWDSVRPIHMLVTDVVMPGMGGTDLALELRRASPDLPVLYISGYLGYLDEEHELLRKRSAFEQKPFTELSLLRTVRRLFDGTANRLSR